MTHNEDTLLQREGIEPIPAPSLMDGGGIVLNPEHDSKTHRRVIMSDVANPQETGDDVQEQQDTQHDSVVTQEFKLHPKLSGPSGQAMARLITGHLMDGTKREPLDDEAVMLTLNVKAEELEDVRLSAQYIMDHPQSITQVVSGDNGEQGVSPTEADQHNQMIGELIKIRDTRIGGRDKISRAQMATYLEFFSDYEGENYLERPLEHPVIEALELNEAQLLAIAVNGKSAIGRDFGKAKDDIYVSLWNEWAGERQEKRGGASVPTNHMWIKGTLAAAEAIAMYNLEHGIGQEEPEAAQVEEATQDESVAEQIEATEEQPEGTVEEVEEVLGTDTRDQDGREDEDSGDEQPQE
jgi:hypothetical protein